jgi:hypothetical protein
MPQPVRVRCHAQISGLVYRPEHAAVIGRIVEVSGRLESSLGWLLAFFSRGNVAITIPIFHEVRSSEARRNILLLTAKIALNGVEMDLFSALIKDYRDRYKERNKIIHNLWSHSNDHPDKALWWQDHDVGMTIATVASVGKATEISTKAALYK